MHALSSDDLVFIFGSLIGMYLVGWSSGFVVYTVRNFLEKL